MTRNLCRCAGLFVWALLFVPATAGAQANNTFGTSVHLLVGQTPVRTTLANAALAYYDVPVVATRSYCAEATASDTEQNATQATVAMIRADQNTAIGTERATMEPKGAAASRKCFIAPASETMFIQVTNNAAGTVEYALRFVETTSWSNWAYTGGGYSSYSILRNTTSTAFNVDIRFFDANGNAAGTHLAQSIAANGVYYIDALGNASSTVATVQVAHDGSPEAIIGSQTTLSALTGLSFDTLFFQRRPW